MNNTILISTQKSGLSLLQIILNCSDKINLRTDNTICKILHKEKADAINGGIYSLCLPYSTIEQIGIPLIDRLNYLKWKLKNSKFVWLVRNPLNVALSCKVHLQQDPEKILSQWYTGNMCIYYLYASLPKHNRQLIRYEDMLENPTSISEVYSLLGVKFHEQYLTYGDFDHSSEFLKNYEDDRLRNWKIDAEHIDPYPKHELAEIFEKYANTELCSYLGYNRNFD